MRPSFLSLTQTPLASRIWTITDVYSAYAQPCGAGFPGAARRGIGTGECAVMRRGAIFQSGGKRAYQASLRDARPFWRLTRGLKPHGYRRETAPRSFKTSKLATEPVLGRGPKPHGYQQETAPRSFKTSKPARELVLGAFQRPVKRGLPAPRWILHISANIVRRLLRVRSPHRGAMPCRLAVWLQPTDPSIKIRVRRGATLEDAPRKPSIPQVSLVVFKFVAIQ